MLDGMEEFLILKYTTEHSQQQKSYKTTTQQKIDSDNMAIQHSYGKTVTSGLVLYLNAADRNSYTSGSATWQDLSGNGNNGTLTNGPTFNSANGGSIQFDGNDDYISMRNFIGNVTTFTVCKWINLSSNQTSRTIFSNYITAGGTNWVTGISDIATNVIKFYRRNHII